MAKYDQTTLLIKHLPHELDVKDRIDLLKHLGASEVSCIASQIKKSSLTFAKFKSKEAAQAVLNHLHQKEVLGQLVSVEYAKAGTTNESTVVGEKSEALDKTSNDVTSQRKLVDAYLKKLNSWTHNLDFTQPPPVHIHYNYPPPTLQILRNICKVLSRVPRFYTQVLHLMNKMNLPCPFVENFKLESDLVPEDFEEPELNEKTLDSSEESEIESDEGKGIGKLSGAFSSHKIAIAKKKVKIKVPKIVKPLALSGDRVPSIKPEEVFDTTTVQVPKRIEVKVSADLSSLSGGGVLEATESFGLLEPQLQDEASKQKVVENEKEQRANSSVISAEELELNRIPSKDFHLLPVFKNYQPGPSTCRLYVKNLAKTVQTSDLEFIFNRYREEEFGEQIHLFDIRLMQEGRMKGQAFVTLQSVALAERALKETNGYILQGKAMVVQFARSSKPK